MNLNSVISDSHSLHVESIGQGEDVFLLHGWGMHSTYWQSVVAELKDSFRIHCIDLPGHGHSSYQQEKTLDDFVQRIAVNIDQITSGPFHLIGWSLGGLISQKILLTQPERIQKLVLIASSPSFVQRNNWPHAMDENVLQGFAENLQQDYRQTLTRFLALQVFGSDNYKQELQELKQKLFSRGEPAGDALAVGLSLLQDVDLRAEMNQLDPEILLLGGGKDKLVPHLALEQMAEQLTNVSLNIIKGAGHAPFMSHVDETVGAIRMYLQK